MFMSLFPPICQGFQHDIFMAGMQQIKWIAHIVYHILAHEMYYLINCYLNDYSI